MRIEQNGDVFKSSSTTNGHEHESNGKFNPSNRKFEFTVDRINRDTRAHSTLYGSISVIDENTLFDWISGSDGCDGLDPNIKQPSIYTRI